MYNFSVSIEPWIRWLQYIPLTNIPTKDTLMVMKYVGKEESTECKFTLRTQ